MGHESASRRSQTGPPAGEPEQLCLVVDWLPWAQETVSCREAAGRLEGTRMLGFVTRAEAAVTRTAYVAVPPATELVVLTRRRGSPVAVRLTKDGFGGLGRDSRFSLAGFTGVQLRGPGGATRRESFAFRQRGVPRGLVDTYAFWRREQQEDDQRPGADAPNGRPGTWRRVRTGRVGVRLHVRWTGRQLCTSLVGVTDRPLAGPCVPQDRAYGGAGITARGVHAPVLPDRIAAVDVVRAGGSGDRYVVRGNGVAVPARRGDRELRLLDREGRVLQVRRV